MERFLKKNGHSQGCAKLFKDPKSKIFLWNVAFWLGAGPLKILTVTPKMGKRIIYDFQWFCIKQNLIKIAVYLNQDLWMESNYPGSSASLQKDHRNSQGCRSRSRSEPGFLAGAGAEIFTRLRLKIERNSIKKVFSLTRSKTNLSILGAQKNIFF